MKNHIFYILDVFAETKYAGNQLAVIRHAADLSTEEMEQIAKEMNYSETTFILSDKMVDGGFDVRIFTPAEEVPFAGHPTLGTAFLIQQEIIQAPVEKVVLNLKAGRIPVTFSYSTDGKPEFLQMQQLPPVFGQTFDSATIAEIVSVEEWEIDSRFPIEEVSTGLPFFIVPLKSLAALYRARINRDKYFELIKNTHAKAILCFAPGAVSPENTLSVRVFCDCYNIPEDPATGSANGCLTGYLTKHRYFGSEQFAIRVEQGAMIGRPSLLMLEGREVNGEIEVKVGGKAILVAKGELF